jgi:hypothetical protein
MLRAEDVKRFTPVSCSLVSLALSVDTASQNLTSSGNDEWMGAVDLHLNLGDQHVKWKAWNNTFLFNSRPCLSRAIVLRMDLSRGL